MGNRGSHEMRDRGMCGWRIKTGAGHLPLCRRCQHGGEVCGSHRRGVIPRLGARGNNQHMRADRRRQFSGDGDGRRIAINSNPCIAQQARARLGVGERHQRMKRPRWMPFDRLHVGYAAGVEYDYARGQRAESIECSREIIVPDRDEHDVGGPNWFVATNEPYDLNATGRAGVRERSAGATGAEYGDPQGHLCGVVVSRNRSAGEVARLARSAPTTMTESWVSERVNSPSTPKT